jgi:hypothetical protein
MDQLATRRAHGIALQLMLPTYLPTVRAVQCVPVGRQLWGYPVYCRRVQGAEGERRADRLGDVLGRAAAGSLSPAALQPLPAGDWCEHAAARARLSTACGLLCQLVYQSCAVLRCRLKPTPLPPGRLPGFHFFAELLQRCTAIRCCRTHEAAHSGGTCGRPSAFSASLCSNCHARSSRRSRTRRCACGGTSATATT